jgi:hypothetical protein
MPRQPHPSDIMTYSKSCIIIIIIIIIVIIIIIDALIYCIFKITDCPITVLILLISCRQVLRQCFTFARARFSSFSFRFPLNSLTGSHKVNVGQFPVPLHELSQVWKYGTLGGGGPVRRVTCYRLTQNITPGLVISTDIYY